MINSAQDSSSQPIVSRAPTKSEVLGDIVFLMMHSELHRKWPIAVLERNVMPALQHNQYRLYKKNDRPIGYVSMALLSDEVERRYLLGGYHLQPQDWASGKNIWMID